MGGGSSTYENIDVTIPCIKYTDDDNGFRGQPAAAIVKIAKYEGSLENGPLKLIREMQDRCDRDEARVLRNRQAILSAARLAARFPNYSNALLRLQSLEHLSSVSSAMKIALAKMGFFVMNNNVGETLLSVLSLGNAVTCFWCGYETSLTPTMPIPLLCSSLHHQCKYSTYIKEYIDVPACIEQNNGNLYLCGKTDCPVCKWNIMP